MHNRSIYQALISFAVAGFLLFACGQPIARRSMAQPTLTRVFIPSQTAGPAPAQPAIDAPAPTTTDPPAPTETATPEPPYSPHLVGYVVGGDLNRPVAAVPGGSLTELIYASVGVSPANRCYSPNLGQAQVEFAALRQLKASYPRLRTLFTISGGSAQFAGPASSPGSRQAFVLSCVQFLQQNGFDGIDIDWEFPGREGKSQEESNNFTALLAEFRKQLTELGKTTGQAYLLTIAAPAGQNEAKGFQLSKIQPLVDWINLMTYNYYDERSATTNLDAALFPVEADPGKKEYNVDSVVKRYLTAGVPARKLMVGVEFYGHGWRGVPAAQDGLYQEAHGAFVDVAVPEGVWSVEGTITYQAIQKDYLTADGWKSYWQAEAQAPWLYNAEHAAFITYENEQSLAAKTDYVLEHQLGGVMVWQVGADASDHTLLKALAGRLLP